MVPLQIQSSDFILWSNPHPSSTKWCRPIGFDYIKENKDTTVAQRNQMQAQIDKLHPTSIDLYGKRFKVHHKLNLTMLDGKTTNYLTDTASSNCNICMQNP